MIALIDGDSIAFILGWHHRLHQNRSEMYDAIDKFLENIFIFTGADQYFGALADTQRSSFRTEIYNVKPYKGQRPELKEFMEFWRPIVIDYLIDKWKFKACNHDLGNTALEADDLIATAAQSCINSQVEFVICSPDKDLRQIPGYHFDYREKVDGPSLVRIDEHQARYNFWKLMIEGDDTDNIAGIPGYGPKKAEEKLKPLLAAQADQSSYEELVRGLYHKHFCQYYGDIIYTETEQAISLVYDKMFEVQIHSVPQKQHPFEALNS